MKLELTRSQAFMALGIAVISADDKCTSQEIEMLLNLFRKLKLIACNSQEECEYNWANLFDETFEKLKTAFPDRQMSMTQKELNILIPIVEQAVGQANYQSLFDFAVAIALSDGLDTREKVILDRLQKDLNIGFKGEYQNLSQQLDFVH
ncbi:MAG: hypothetical protein WBC69_18400 [Geitlerinemataceae cyanobacterium]